MSPISVYLCGKSNIGKSHLIIHLVKLLNNSLYKFKDYNKCVYARTVTTEHWDGYHGQPLVVFDDHYKMQDGKQEIDARETMNCVSCTNYYPSFAHLEKKGTALNSEILIFSSNVGWPITMYVPEALHRRHKHHIIVIPNGKDMNANFTHLDLYYAKSVINPWNGCYSNNFTELHDIPYNMDEFHSFPHNKFYVKITIDDLVDIVVKDLLAERAKFKSVS